jgi:hypothetical protein
VADDRRGGGREDVRQKGEGACRQQHQVGVVLIAQEGDLLAPKRRVGGWVR